MTILVISLLAGVTGRGAPVLSSSVNDQCGMQLGSGHFSLPIILTAAKRKVDAETRVDYCELSVTIHPTPGSDIGAMYRLPDHWNGRMLGLGGGGQAGNVRYQSAQTGLARGYATVQTDGGHASESIWDSSWAERRDGSANWDAIIDFAYRAIHATAVIGKQLITGYYARAPTTSTFQGCSTGGRQGLLEAQRYPDDYDAIIAGAPVYDERVGSGMVAAGRAFESERTHLSSTQIATVHEEVLKRCDALDGLKDGIVAEPDRCDFDPQTLACPSGRADGQCLAPEQVQALRRFYATLRAPDGSVVAFGVPYGSELTSIPRFMEWGGEVASRVGLEHFRIVQFDNAKFDLHQWDLLQDLPRLRASAYGLLQDATNLDLSSFIHRGGRLLVWHGLYDDLPRAGGTVEYFNAMQQVSRIQLKLLSEPHPHVEDQTRLFLAPGVLHCGGGPGADEIDALAVMERWQSGEAPRRIIAEHRATADDSASFSRPWCAYPAKPRYRGTGDPKSADSFECR